MATYNPLSTDEEAQVSFMVGDGDSLRFDAPVPISRPPTSPRDPSYASAYFFMFVGVSLVGFIHHTEFLHDSFVLYQQAGGWTSMLMVATLFGTVIGIFLMFALYYPPLRELVLQYAIPCSIGVQCVAGVAAYIGLGSQCWPITLLVLGSAACDAVRYTESLEVMAVTEATLELAFQVLGHFDTPLAAALIALGVVQTGLLLWWGVVFVGLLTEVHAAVAVVAMLLLSFAAYWTVQVFQSIVSTVSGACVLWFFLREESAELQPDRRVSLYIRTTLSTSLGSMCKGALLIPISQVVLTAGHWAASPAPPRNLLEKVLRQTVHVVVCPLVDRLRLYSRLVYPIIGTYGHSFQRASVEANSNEGVGIVLDGMTNLVLKAVAKGATMVVLLVFAVSGRADPSLPLFLVVSFYLILAGAGLMINSVRAAVDTFSIAFTANPTVFARLSPVVFHRFVRMREEK